MSSKSSVKKTFTQTGVRRTVNGEVDTERLQSYRESPFYKKVLRYLATISGPKVVDDVVSARMEKCLACKYLKETDDGRWCGTCGCGYRKAAELKVKLQWARVECPAGHFDAIDEDAESHLLRGK